jgi:oxygen-independent coproporphyrinogen-3 oxidase
MDSFRAPNDELAVASANGRCTEISVTTKAGADLYGMGVSAISSVGACYAQNDRDVAPYRGRIEQRGLATMRGYRLTAEDLLRRAVINRILCHGVLHKNEIEREFEINFDKTFAPRQRLAHSCPTGFELEDGVLPYDSSGAHFYSQCHGL